MLLQEPPNDLAWCNNSLLTANSPDFPTDSRQDNAGFEPSMFSKQATPDLSPEDLLVESSSITMSPKENDVGQNSDFQTSVNNSAFAELYTCPETPNPPCNIGLSEFVQLRNACRMALYPNKNKYVTLTFRVMRFDAEMHVGLILGSGHVKRSALYSPIILDMWTRKLRIKIKASVKVSAVFKSLSARLGLHNTIGIKYCLDGFYGIEAFGDAFGNYGAGICPWMEVTGDGTPLSLNLEDSDNIYISRVTEKMIDLVQKRIQQVSEQAFKQAQKRSLRLSVMSLRTLQQDPTTTASDQEGPEVIEG